MAEQSTNPQDELPVVTEKFSIKLIRRNFADGDEGSGKTEELIHEPTVNRLFMPGS